MRERCPGHHRSIRVIGLATLLALAFVALPATHARDLRQPQRFAPGLDDGLAQLDVAARDGLWSAWTYRSGGESSIALSALDPEGHWSPPVFLGAGDGLDQDEPALASDAAGRVYVVFSDRASGALMISVLGTEASGWSAPHRIPGAVGHAPAVRVLGDLVVIAYRDGARTRLLTRPVGGPDGEIGTHTIYDGPDPVGSCADDGSCPNDDEDERRMPRSDSGNHDSVTGFGVFEVPEELDGAPAQRGGRTSSQP